MNGAENEISERIQPLLAALSLSELATGMPIAGVSYHYGNHALGCLFGSIVGWACGRD